MWISSDIFKLNLKSDDRLENVDVRRSVDWFTSFLEPSEWERRRFAAFKRFIETATGESTVPLGKGRFFDENDRFAWYLLLGENWLERPMLNDTTYASRVIPVLMAIGRNLETLKIVPGVEQRVQRMVTKEKAQPNGCLFELLVAAAYLREGAAVTFLDEKPGVAKTHDMDVQLRGLTYAVECKRLEGSEYQEIERKAARDIWIPVAQIFEEQKMSVRCDIEYVAELITVPHDYLAQKALQWISQGGKLQLSWSDDYSIGKLSQLNLAPLQSELERRDVPLHGTQMHKLLLGKYKRNASVLTNLFIRLADNPLYIKACERGSVCNWSSVNQVATESKARDVLKRVSEGCAQLPDGKRGVVHIGLEAVEGDDVEQARFSRIQKSLTKFDPKGKLLEYVYVHWFAPESPPNKAFDFEETRHFEAIHPMSPPPMQEFLVLPKGSTLDTRAGGHWAA